MGINLIRLQKLQVTSFVKQDELIFDEFQFQISAEIT